MNQRHQTATTATYTNIKTNTNTNRQLVGGTGDLRNVLEKCKAKGLGVVLDFLYSKASKSPPKEHNMKKKLVDNLISQLNRIKLEGN